MPKSRVELPWLGSVEVDRMKAKENGEYIREKSASPYHTKRWTLISRNFRQDHPFCKLCADKGIIKEARCVDHIIPFPICDDFYDRNNLQALCNECNTLKGERDRKKIQEYKKTHPHWMDKYK